MRKPSASLAVATLALAVALTGTAGAAGLIDGHSIKNHSITANKLAKGAVTAPAIKDHAIHKLALADGVIVNNTVIAPAGPQGPTGASGANGVTAIDPSRLSIAVGADAITPAAGSAASSAICPAGTYVVGGGYSSLGSGVNQLVIATDNEPVPGANGWNVATHNYGGSDQALPWHAIAYCAAI